MSARVKLRIRALNHLGTVEEQADRVRQAVEVDRRYINTIDFATWARDRMAYLTKLANEQRRGK